MPDVVLEIDVKYFLLTRLLGVKIQSSLVKVQKLKANEMLMINIGSNSLAGKVLTEGSDAVRI